MASTDRSILTVATNSGYWTCATPRCRNIAEMATAISNRHGEALCGPCGERERARQARQG